MGYDVRQGDPLIFLLVSSTDHISGVTGLTPTVTIRKKGELTWAAPIGAIEELGNGNYQVAGNLLDSDTKGPLLLHAEAAGCDPMDTTYSVVSLVDSDDEDDTTSDTEISISEIVQYSREASNVTVDGHSVTERSAADIIAFDEYIRAKKAQAAGASGWGGANYRKAIPPGTSGGNERL